MGPRASGRRAVPTGRTELRPSVQIPVRDQCGAIVPPPPDPLNRRIQAAPTWWVLALATGIVVATLSAIVVVTATASVTATYSPLSGRLHQAVVGLPVVLVLYEAGRRFVLRAPASSFLAGRPDGQVARWAVAGLAFPATVLGLQLAGFGGTLTRPPVPLGAAAGLVVASLAAGLLAAVVEELAFRGALLRLLTSRWGPRVGVGATAVVFAALHQGHASGRTDLLLVLAAMTAAGVLLAVIVVRTRSVWNAVVVHAGWNGVFGGRLVAVGHPGDALAPAVLQYRLPEPAGWVTGDAASLGASPVTTACLLVAAVVVWHWSPPERRPESPANVGVEEQ